MKKLIQLFIVFFLIINIGGCAKPQSNIDQNLGGWVGNDAHKDENDTSDENKNTSNKDNSSNTNHNLSNSEGEKVDKITYNTDPMLSGVSVEIEEYFGKHIIFKVTNNSDNCYRFLSTTLYFKCMPLPGRPLLEEDEEFDNGYIFENIPAHSTTYFLEDALGEMMAEDKGADEDGMVYYDFDPKYNSYRIELRGSDDPWSPTTLSKNLIQDASDYIVFNRETYNDSTNKLGDLTNKSNRPIMINGFVVFTNGKVAEIQNGSELIDSQYENIIPPYNQDYKTPTNKIYDCNSIYTYPYDFSGDSQFFDIYINTWFQD